MLYRQFDARDPSESVLAKFIVAVTNAGMDCFVQAARVARGDENHHVRDMKLRHGLRAASVAAELLEALERRRGQDSKKVSVGQVNVEAGAQAIVGHVQVDRQPDALRPNDNLADSPTKKSSS